MRFICSLLLLLALSVTTSAQSAPEAYRLYRQGGKPVKWKKMVARLAEADVILFGESHNNAVCHWLQLELLRALPEADLGLEMFETDEQRWLEGYGKGRVNDEQLDSLTGGVWPNFRTDYKPLVLEAARRGAAVIATNVPRVYARRVFRQGLESLEQLTEEEKALLSPLPIPYDPELPGYRRMLEMMPGGHGGATFPMAQAIKDATMAAFIVRNRRTGMPFLHLNGSYHSDDFEGIGWYLRQYAPELKVVTLTTAEQEEINRVTEEYREKADFIIVTNDAVTRTY